MPFNQQLDTNGRAIMAIGYDPVTHQPIMQLGGPGVLDTASGIVYGPSADAPVDGFKATYTAAIQGIVPAATPTDVFIINGSPTAGHTIRVTRIEIAVLATTVGSEEIYLVKRSTADGANGVALTPVPHDASSSPTTATAQYFNTSGGNPASLGTTVGTIRTVRAFWPIATGVGSASAEPSYFVWDFGTRPSQAIVLRGAAQGLAIWLNSVTVPSGGTMSIACEYTEDTYS